ncbi:MAG: hypothetical protein ACRC2T_04815 [Thermoguttaceae bacterium]
MASHPHFFTQIDVSTDSSELDQPSSRELLGEMCGIMRDMLAAQDRQNELIEELVGQISLSHRQRMYELSAWKKSNPELAQYCKSAADKLGKVQTDMLSTITGEVEDGYETFLDSEYALGDFVERFGPRFAHLNGLLQVLAQLGNAPDYVPVRAATSK